MMTDSPRLCRTCAERPVEPHKTRCSACRSYWRYHHAERPPGPLRSAAGPAPLLPTLPEAVARLLAFGVPMTGGMDGLHCAYCGSSARQMLAAGHGAGCVWVGLREAWGREVG